MDLDTFVIKTERVDNDTNCFDENPVDFASAQHEEVPIQSAAAFSDDPATIKQRFSLVTCELCDKTIKLGSVYNHKKRFHTSDPRPNASVKNVRHRVGSHHRFKKIQYTIKAESSKARQDLVACAYCGKMIKLCSLHNHTTRFHVNDPLKFSCDQCDRKFYKKDILAKHVMIHIPDEFKSRSFKCDACDQTFIRLNALRSHKAHKHATRKLQPVECHCGKTFKSKESLMWHNKRTHKRHEYERTCQESEKVVPDSTALKSHIRVYHTEGGMRNFMCNICGKFFHRQFELTKHEKSHAEKSFACILEGCGKKFLRIQQLNLHTKITHMNLREFACSHIGCMKRFSTNQRLLRHIKISHENIREKCPVIVCAFQHGVRVSLLNHLMKHSELNRDDLERHLKTVKAMKLQ